MSHKKLETVPRALGNSKSLENVLISPSWLCTLDELCPHKIIEGDFSLLASWPSNELLITPSQALIQVNTEKTIYKLGREAVSVPNEV